MGVYTLSENIITSLGLTIDDHIKAFEKGISGINPDPVMPENLESVPLSIIDNNNLFQLLESEIPGYKHFTRFESLLVLSMQQALKNTTVDPSDPRTLTLLSTTKGN